MDKNYEFESNYDQFQGLHLPSIKASDSELGFKLGMEIGMAMLLTSFYFDAVI